MRNIYYFSTAKDDFIIDFERHYIERVPRKIAKSLALEVTALTLKNIFLCLAAPSSLKEVSKRLIEMS